MNAELQITEALNVRLQRFQEMSFDQISAFPETTEEKVVIDGKLCTFTTYVQKLSEARLLVTVQWARRTLLGLVNLHRERGLIFSPSTRVREATPEELMGIE